VLPKLAAFGYFVVAALAVLSARGEARLTLRGPTPRQAWRAAAIAAADPAR
jgi:hypothetical protein